MTSPWIAEGGEELPLLVIPADPYGVGPTANDAMLRKAAYAQCRQRFLGLQAVNRLSGDVISVSARGIKHSIYGARSPLIRCMAVLPEIIERASKTGAQMDKNGRPDIVRVHKYEVDLLDDDLPLVALVVAREMRDGAKNFYDLSFLAR